MQRPIRIATVTASAALLAFTGTIHADVVDTRELMETIPVPANEPLVVIVKNIIGPIHVTGHDANRVEMRATETVRGDVRLLMAIGNLWGQDSLQRFQFADAPATLRDRGWGLGIRNT